MMTRKDIGLLVFEDIEARIQFGEKAYGSRLMPFNGRDALIDAYQEAIDLMLYLRQKIEEDRPGCGCVGVYQQGMPI